MLVDCLQVLADSGIEEREQLLVHYSIFHLGSKSE